MNTAQAGDPPAGDGGDGGQGTAGWQPVYLRDLRAAPDGTPWTQDPQAAADLLAALRGL